MKNWKNLFPLFALILSAIFSTASAQTITVINSKPHQDGDFLIILGLKLDQIKMGQTVKVQTLCPNAGKKINPISGKNLKKVNDQQFKPEKLGKPCEIFFDLEHPGDDWNHADTVKWLVQITIGSDIKTFTGDYIWEEVENILNLSQPKYPVGTCWEKYLRFPAFYQGDSWTKMEIAFNKVEDFQSLLTVYGLIRGQIDPRWADDKWQPTSFGYGSWSKGINYGLPNLDCRQIKNFKKEFKRNQKKGLTTQQQDEDFALLNSRIEQFNLLEKKVFSGGGNLTIWRTSGKNKVYTFRYDFGPLKQ